MILLKITRYPTKDCFSEIQWLDTDLESNLYCKLFYPGTWQQFWYEVLTLKYISVEIRHEK